MSRRATSEAYDFSLFETKPKIQKQEKNELKVIKGAKRRENAKAIMQGVFLTVVLVAVTSVLIYSKLTLNEVTAQISIANKNYNELLSEKTRLDMELESKVSLKNVEEVAESELGLTKITSQQIQYIQVANANGITVSQSDQKFDLFETIREEIHNLLAYIQN